MINYVVNVIDRKQYQLPVLPKKEVYALKYPKLPTEVTIMLPKASFCRLISGILTPRWRSASFTRTLQCLRLNRCSRGKSHRNSHRAQTSRKWASHRALYSPWGFSCTLSLGRDYRNSRGLLSLSEKLLYMSCSLGVGQVASTTSCVLRVEGEEPSTKMGFSRRKSRRAIWKHATFLVYCNIIE